MHHTIDFYLVFDFLVTIKKFMKIKTNCTSGALCYNAAPLFMSVFFCEFAKMSHLYKVSSDLSTFLCTIQGSTEFMWFFF